MTERQSYIIPEKEVIQLRRGGKQMARESRRASRRQWYFGRLANQIWDSLPSDVKEELRILDFYAEASQWINRDLDFPVISESGETLRRWADNERHYRSYPNVEAWKGILSFDHFDKARFIGADPRTNVTSTEALAFALHHNLTADDMRKAFEQRDDENPALLEYRKKFAKWMGDIPDVLFRMNGNKAQAEHHAHELERLVREEQKEKGDNDGTKK